MLRRRALSATTFAVLVTAVALAPAQAPKSKVPVKDAAKPAAQSLGAAHGTVVKADQDAVTVKPRGESGRFEKDLVLQVTGTTKVTQLTVQNRGGKPVPVQQDADVKSLQPQQAIAVIYAETGGGQILLSAVVLPAAK
jgi:hypothetical protein